MRKDKVREFNNYFVLYLLVGQSSMPFLNGDIFLIIGFIYALFLFIVRNIGIDRKVLLFSFVFFLLFVIHIIISGLFIPSVFIAFFLRIFFAYFVVKLLSEKFSEYYIRGIIFFSISSLILYVLLVVFRNFENYLTTSITPFFYRFTYLKDYQHFIIFTINLESNTIFPRNPGPFWEAGGFGIFLNIALLFNIIKTQKFFNRINILFLITIITTQSTGTYLTTFSILVSYFVFARRISYFILLLPAFIYIGYSLFFQLPFLNDKMTNEISGSMVSDYKHSPRGRLISARVDFDDYIANPLFGKGRFRETNVKGEDYQSSEDYRNNGTTQILAEFGTFGFLIYFIFIYLSYKYYCYINKFSLNYAFIIVFIFLLMGFSQGIFTKPFFFSLCFLFMGGYTKYPKGEKN